MIRLLWITCSIPVFVYTLKYCIQDELEAYGELDPFLLILFTFLALLLAAWGPFIILGYILFNVIATIAGNISENYQNKTR